MNQDQYAKFLGEAEYKKYCAAKMAWSQRNFLTAPKKDANGLPIVSKVTYSEWFEKKFGESLLQYRHRFHQQHQEHMKMTRVVSGVTRGTA